jgi:hypothetical protein
MQNIDLRTMRCNNATAYTQPNDPFHVPTHVKKLSQPTKRTRSVELEENLLFTLEHGTATEPCPQQTLERVRS